MAAAGRVNNVELYQKFIQAEDGKHVRSLNKGLKLIWGQI